MEGAGRNPVLPVYNRLLHTPPPPRLVFHLFGALARLWGSGRRGAFVPAPPAPLPPIRAPSSGPSRGGSFRPSPRGQMGPPDTTIVQGAQMKRKELK